MTGTRFSLSPERNGEPDRISEITVFKTQRRVISENQKTNNPYDCPHHFPESFQATAQRGDPGTARRLHELRRQSKRSKETKADTEFPKEEEASQRNNSRKL